LELGYRKGHGPNGHDAREPPDNPFQKYAPLTSVVQPTSDQRWPDSDEGFMRLALDLALKAEAEGEVPVGAVVVHQGSVVGQGWNRPISARDPTSHAEIEALRQASTHLQNYRLLNCTIYVTLEPCVMCAGAIVLARIERLVFAARDLRFGAVRSKFRLADSDLLNHRVQVEEGLLAADAAELLDRFFRRRRI
jgi:tRNA(adenine34) deaminase